MLPILLYLGAAAALPFVVRDPYVLDTVAGASLLLAYVRSWELHAVPSREASFGHASFVGGGAYLSAWLATHGVAPPAAVAIVLATSSAVGFVLGLATAGARGAAFSLATMGCALMLHQAAYLFPQVFGGEEGILGVPPLAAGVHRYWVTWGATCAVVAVAALLERSAFGLRFRITGADEAVALSCGVPTRRIRATGLAASGALGALAGAAYAHAHGQVHPELLAGELSIRIALLGLLAAGRWTLAVVLGAFFLRESLAGLTRFEGVVYAVALFAAIVIKTRGAPRVRAATG